jgi:cellulose synthase/poly-beta-1,6-N-acetylglucosamine synthase-like glycosyltransferase
MKKTISIIVTAANEPNSISLCLERLLDTNVNGLKGIQKYQFEIITVIPDEETNKIATATISKFSDSIIRHIKLIDPWQGKPFALNLAFKKANGDYLVLTDGDVYFSKDALGYLVNKLVKGDKYSAVTGRPVSKDSRKNFWGYIGHLLADAANDKRQVTMIDNRKFFVMSGYIMAMKNLKISIPKDCLSDDAFISYFIHNNKLRIGYEPTACVNVKYPKNFKDWINQKSRSVGGYVQLWSYGIVKKETKVRNFWKELEYFLFPIKYSRNIKEFFWSVCLYPLRLYLWLRIFWEQKIKRREIFEPWTRIESTK